MRLMVDILHIDMHFLEKKIVLIQSKIHLSLFPKIFIAMSHPFASGDILAPNRGQATTWPNDEPVCSVL